MTDEPKVRDGPFPESNVDSVAINLDSRTVDFDGGGLVEVLGVLTARAEHIKTLNVRAARFEQEVLAGQKVPEQDEFNAVLLDAWYETTCLKWFVACAFKKLSEHLEYEVHQKQNHMRRIRRVVYNDAGEVESYELDPQ